MRPTDVCFPSHSLRAPAPRALPWPSNGHGESGVSRRLDSLRRAKGPSVRGVLFPVSGLFTAPLMLLSRLSSARLFSSRSADLLSRRQDRFGHAPRERRMAPTTRSTFHRQVTSSSRLSRNRFRPRETELAFCRPRDFAITTRRSTLLRCTRSPRGHLAVTLSSRPFARPRLRESSFGLGRIDSRSSGPDAAYRLLQRLRRASTPKRAFDHRPRRRPRSHPRCCPGTRTWTS